MGTGSYSNQWKSKLYNPWKKHVAIPYGNRVLFQCLDLWTLQKSFRSCKVAIPYGNRVLFQFKGTKSKVSFDNPLVAIPYGNRVLFQYWNNHQYCMELPSCRNPLWEPGLIPISDLGVTNWYDALIVAIPYGNRVLFQLIPTLWKRLPTEEFEVAIPYGNRVLFQFKLF